LETLCTPERVATLWSASGQTNYLIPDRADINESTRQAMFDALRVASMGIKSVKRFHIGRQVTHGGASEKLMVEDYPYAAVIEFEDLDGLQGVSQPPKTRKAGEPFYALSEAGLVHDYELTSPATSILSRSWRRSARRGVSSTTDCRRTSSS
jgi:hypothetical protein